MSCDFDSAVYRYAGELDALAELHIGLGTKGGRATARVAWGGAGALLELLARGLPAERYLTRGSLGYAALSHYAEAGLGEQAQRLAVRLLQTELEPSRRETIARLRGSRPLEAFPALRDDLRRAA